jgi:hypothetical protein
MKKRDRKIALATIVIIVLALTVDYQIRGIDSPAAYVVFAVIGILRPGPLPLFLVTSAGSAGA